MYKVTAWRTSSCCPITQCVEVALLGPNAVGLRDTKQSALAAIPPRIVVSVSQFQNFLAEMTAEPVDHPGGAISVVKLENGDTVFRSLMTGVELRFDQDEIDAFVAGIRAGEFTPEALMQPVS